MAWSVAVFVAMGTLISLVNEQLHRARQQLLDVLKKSEKELQNSEIRLLAIGETAQVGLAVVDADCVYRYINTAYARIFQLPLRSFLDQKVESVLPDAWETQLKERFLECLNGKTLRFVLDYQPRAPGALLRRFEIFCEPGQGQYGRQVIAVVLDVTEKLAAESQLSEVVALVASSADAIVGISLDGRITSWNPGAERVFGYSAAEIIGRPTSVVYLPDQELASLEIHRRVLSGEKVEAYESVGFRKDQCTIDVSVAYSAIRNNCGDIVGVSLVARDISAQKLAEKLRGESEERFRHLFDNMQEGFFLAELIYDSAGKPVDWRFLEVNQAHGRILQMPREAVVGHTVRELFPGLEDFWFDAHVRAALSSEPTSAEGFVGDTGRYYLNHYFSPQRGQFACIFSDVTERRQAEVALRESEAKFRKLVKLAPVPLGFVSSEETEIECNEQFTQLLGYTMSDLPSLAAWWEKAYPDRKYRARVIETWSAAVKRASEGGGNIQPLEFQVTCKDGSEKTLLISGAPLGDGIISAFVDVTERNQTEKQLLEAERFSASTIEALSAHLCVLDEVGRVLRVNDAWRRFAAENPPADANAYLGFNYLDVCDRASARGVEQAGAMAAGIRSVMSGEAEYFLLEYPCHSEREQRWFSARVTRFLGDGPLRLVVAHENVIRRRLAENLIIGQNRILEMIARSRPLPEMLSALAATIEAQSGGGYCSVALLDPTGTHLKIEAAPSLPVEFRQAIDGCSVGLAESTGSLQTPLVMTDIGRAAECSEAREIALRVGIRGSWSSTIWGEQGRMLGQLTIYLPYLAEPDHHQRQLMDTAVHTAAIGISRARSESALREQSERFRQIAENINEVFWMRDPETCEVLYVSPAYETVWGQPLSSVYQDSEAWMEAVHPQDRGRVSEAAALVIQGNGTLNYRIVRPNGEVRWIQDRAFPVRDSAGKVYRVVGTATDITEHRNLEERLRQSQKMEAIGTLAGGIAHDFNNILGAIIGYTELARMDLGPSVADESLEEVLRAGQRARDLVRQILAFSRQQEQERVPMALGVAVEEAYKLLRAALPSTLELNLEIAPDLPMILGDPAQIQRVVVNLCTNAAHAIGSAPGSLLVSVTTFVADDAFLNSHPECRAGKYVRLSVRDTGHGMDRGTLERIFDPFFTTKAPGEGSGLGLAVVHGIVQVHDGFITAESRLGEGTELRLHFPSHDGHELRPSVAPGRITRGQGELVLVVEDERPLAQMIGRMLVWLGYSAEVATDAGDALASVRRDPSRYQLILTDLTMPGMTGMEFSSIVLRENPGTRIVLMTGYAAKFADEQAQSLGLVGLLLKPITMEGLSESVHQALCVQEPK